ncbi:hypothetical protein J437_LFUL007489 [Ladona fulva]|uniref:Uncharacterized protein n=1 Tax=Ladona fulva TaxID=123851 RepID=A0A8K0P6M8_LADFU|nr:hypothetical protein J437_LFUL007489 [Ladona fulva]
MVNQQQEFEVQESRLPQQQLRVQDSRPQPEVKTQSLRKQQCEEGLPIDQTEATPDTSKNGQPSPNKSVKQEPVLQRHKV